MPSFPDKLPNPPSAPFFWGGNAWDWFASSIRLIYLAVRAQQTSAQDALIISALATINITLEKLVTQSDSLAAEVATLKSNVASLASEIASQISDLAAEIAKQGQSNPAVDAAIADLQATNSQLATLVSNLQADNAPSA